MAYIRGKTCQGKRGEETYYCVVETYRENGKVRQRTIAYLGWHCPTVQQAIRRAIHFGETANDDKVLTRLAKLRAAAAKLGITDPDSLYLPGSAAYAALETERKRPPFRGRALAEAQELIRSAQKPDQW